jgi:Cu(I)/Ag(I) efflux system membrane fusion protein
MGEQQISALLQHGKVETLSPVYSKADGIITDVKLREGDYVTEGGIVFEMNNFHSVWVQGQLYAGETNTVKEGDWVAVHLFDYPAQNFRAQVNYIQPELNGNSKILPLYRAPQPKHVA